MLRVRDLRLAYRSDRGTVEAVRGVSFSVERGEFYTLLGPSGCGKTSTLRCVAGLETPTSGEIEIDNELVYSSTRHTAVAPHKRGIGMVFQSYAIWPHMTVFENVAFPLTRGGRKLPGPVVRDRVMRALSLVQLDGMADRPAPNLSGGQQQRVALARAIVREPSVLLLDEPLSNLDAKLREDMRQEIKALVRRLGTTTLYVTHDQVEALAMSDTVALMRDGQLVQEGSPRSVYQQPADTFAANFLGRTNVLVGRVDAARSGVDTRWGHLSLSLPGWAGAGDEVSVGFRPEGVQLQPDDHSDGANMLRGTVVSVTFTGDAEEYHVELGGRMIRARRDAQLAALDEGAAVSVYVPPDRCYVLSEGTTSDR